MRLSLVAGHAVDIANPIGIFQWVSGRLVYNKGMTPEGAPLYEQIYTAVRMIPRGRVSTYGTIARLVGGCSAQMVGFALAAVTKDDDVPWQRVINAKGKISPHGFGFGSALQRDLLEEEGVVFDLESRVDLERFGWP